MTLSYGDLKKGMAIEMNGEPYIVVDYDRSKMQQRAPVVRVRLREIRTGKMTDRTFQGYDIKLRPASVDWRSAQYIYRNEGMYYFMDTTTFEQLPMSEDHVGDAARFLKEETTVSLAFFEGQAIALELPIAVELRVTETEPGLRGDTAQGGTKPATLETGVVVQVPLFVDVDQAVRVDTRTGQYVSRV